MPQAAFLLDDSREALYGGAAGGGKSDALLMAALQYVDVPGYAALLLRRTFAELSKSDGLIPRAEEWLAGTDAKRADGGKLWVFPSGARLEFGHVQNETDKHNYQSAAYQFAGFDELTSFTESIYDYIGFSRARRPMFGGLSRVPVRTRAASNPGNIGHLWVKSRYVDAETRKPGAVFVPARVTDNPGLDVEEYRAGMADLPEALRRQLLEGDWGALEGAAYTIAGEHLVEDFRLRDSFDRFEAADYGLNGAPWCLFAVDYEGNLVAVDMLYERDRLPDEVAAAVIARRASSWGQPSAAWIDPSVWHRTGQRNKWGAPAMLADEFADAGVAVQPANNDPRAGLVRARSLLAVDPAHPFPSWHPRAGERGAPRIFFTPKVSMLLDELRAAPLQTIDKRDGGEIVDPAWESRYGHSAAMFRYAVLTRPGPSVEPPETDLHLTPPDPPSVLRREALRRFREERDNPQVSRRRDYIT